MIKIGGLYQVNPGNFGGRCYIEVWADTFVESMKSVATLNTGDYFVVLAHDGLYAEVLVCKNGQSGFITRFATKASLNYFAVVETQQ